VKIAWVILVVAFAGCATAPAVSEDDGLEVPRASFLAEALPQGEPIESRAYAYEGELEVGHGLEKLLRVALPEGAFGEASSVSIERGSLGIVETKTAHERISRLMSAIAGSRRDTGFTVNVYDVPLETAQNLGPLQVARGGDLNAFLRVPLGPAVVARLDRLARKRQIVRLSEGAAAGRPGTWLRFRDQNERVVAQGLGLDGSHGIAAETTVGTTGVIVDAAAVPFPDGSVLLAFEAEDAIALATATLVAYAGHGNTRVPVELPSWIRRRALDTVLLRPQESLALVSAGESGRVHLIVISPFYRL
jgi:hypothetical protein